jgi:beta-glucosidase
VTETRFPREFAWGVATSSYQIEGAVDEDGRGESIWDRFVATPGKVHNGDSAAVAADHYHRFREDVALMRELGVRAYRFSVAWPRIMPSGTGRVNSTGLDFYDRLVDELLAHDIEPFLTLYHWDLPQALEDAGGWKSRNTAEAFGQYAEALVQRLGDRVSKWMTHNEPWCTAWLGYGNGEHAPGRAEGAAGAVPVAHHVLLSHGLATQAIRALAPAAQVGIALNLFPTYVGDDRPETHAAARRMDGQNNRWFLDPIFRGSYPSDLEDLIRYLPQTAQDDLKTASVPIDFLGVNYYHRDVYAADQNGQPVHISMDGAEQTDMGWEVYPDGLHALLTRLRDEYSPSAIYITENGAAYSDAPGPDGTVQDIRRREYVEQHLNAALRSMQDGVPLRGYFLWSLLDNFEWAHGYSKRFGITYVDYTTLRRVPKHSAYWYRDFIADQAS